MSFIVYLCKGVIGHDHVFRTSAVSISKQYLVAVVPVPEGADGGVGQGLQKEGQ